MRIAIKVKTVLLQRSLPGDLGGIHSNLLKEQPKMEQRATTNKKNVKPIAVDTDRPFLLAIRVVDESNHSAIIPDEIFTEQTLAAQKLALYDYVYLLKGRFYTK